MEVSGKLQNLPPGKESLYPLDKMFGGPRSRSERCGEEKNLAPTGIRTPGGISSMHAKLWLENLNRRDQLKDLD
jgi:hypothetical protein